MHTALAQLVQQDPIPLETPANPVGSIILALLVIAIYVYAAYCIYVIAKKTNTPYAWMAWVPILNAFLMLKIARLSLWWFLAILIPFVNIIVLVYVWWKFAQVVNRPGWWGILMLISPINLILLWFMAFRDPGSPAMPAQPMEIPPAAPAV